MAFLLPPGIKALKIVSIPQRLVDAKPCYTLVSLLVFIKILSDQLFGNSYFPINTTLQRIKHEF